jgi:hypothetical protein
MYTIRRTATIVVVAVGLAATSAGLASAAGGELADTAPATPAAAAFPAAAGATGSTPGAPSDATGAPVEGGQAWPGAAAGAAPVADHAGSASVVVRGDEAGSAWCSPHRLAVVAFGETWFGGVHVGSVCDHPRP